MKVCLGGTFNRLHEGHKALITQAFALSLDVLIGLSSDEFARQMKGEARSYEERKAALLSFCASIGKHPDIVPISDPYGPAGGDAALTDIVVSEETAPVTEQINAVREKHGLQALSVHIIPLIRDAKGNKISSTKA